MATKKNILGLSIGIFSGLAVALFSVSVLVPETAVFPIFASNEQEISTSSSIYEIPSIKDEIFLSVDEQDPILTQVQNQRMQEEIELMAEVKKVEDLYKKYKAPMASNAEYLVRTSQKHGVDYKLIVAISIVESGGGRVCFRTYNPFGWGKKDFSSFDEAILTVVKGISTGYYKRGLNTVEEIGPVYNAGNVEGWINKINNVISEI